MKPNDRYPWWTSLVARSTFVLALLLMLAAFGTAWLVHRAARDRVLAQAQADDRHVLDLAAQRLGSYAITLDDDIAFLADNAPLRAYTAALDAGDTALARAALLDLSSLMRSFLRSRPTYAQVRYIAADSAGMEIVRFNAKAGVVEQVPDSLLQPKGDRDFHRATMALPGDRRYFSAMDLNMEHGTVERPLVPTLRAALGIDRPSGIRAGIVVINADLRPLFDELASLQPPHATLLLADEAGQLLLHPDSARCFHVLLGRGEGLAAELAAASDAERWSVVRRTVRPERLPYALTLVVRRDLSPLLAELKAGRDRILGWAAGAAAVVALLWLVLARATALRLSRLTARVERHAAGEGAEALPVHRRDEIGRLARSIEHMQARIDQRVKELEEARASAVTWWPT